MSQTFFGRYVAVIQTVFMRIGLGLVSASSLRALQENTARLAKLEHYINLVQRLDLDFSWLEFKGSSSQIHQDLVANWVALAEPNNVSSQRVFIEIGAADGIENSNTFFLENSKGWSGLLVEPNPSFKEILLKNRPEAVIDNRAASSGASTSVEFVLAGQFSGLAATATSDMHAFRRKGRSIRVASVGTEQILDDAGIPSRVNFLSIDTEGSELEILRSIDFGKRSYSFITVEHNFVEPKRQEIFALLSRNRFVRVFEDLSQFDDWYVAHSVAQRLGLS